MSEEGLSAVHAAIDAALAVDLQALTDAELLGRVVAAERAMNRLAALKLVALEKVDRRGAVLADHGSTAAWLRTTTNTTAKRAARDVHLARDLADTMPAMADAMAAGDVTSTHAQIAAGLRKDSADDAVRETDPQVTEAARRMPLHEFRAFITQLRHALDRDKVAADERDAYDHRELTADTTIYGLGVGRWLLDPVSHEIVMSAVHVAADPLKADPQTTGRQRLADGLVTVAQFFLDHHAEPASTKKAFPHLLVTVDHHALAPSTGHTGIPAATTGYGATISSSAAQRLLCDSAVSRIVFGPNSEVIDAGRTSRTFTSAARRCVIARDQHCRWPGCIAPAAWCEVHHALHWGADDGPSDVDNGILLCGRHHDRLHHHDHAVLIATDGRRSVDTERGSGRRFGRVHDLRPPKARGDPEPRAG